MKPHRLCRYMSHMLFQFIDVVWNHLFNIWLVITSEFYISPRRLKWGGWAGVPFWFHCVCPSQSWRARFSQPFANDVQYKVGGGNVKESKCWNYATCHKVTVEHIHMWWCVCDVCCVWYPPWLPSGKRTAENSWRHVQFYFLRFVNREGERSVVSVVVFMFWFT